METWSPLSGFQSHARILLPLLSFPISPISSSLPIVAIPTCLLNSVYHMAPLARAQQSAGRRPRHLSRARIRLRYSHTGPRSHWPHLKSYSLWPSRSAASAGLKHWLCWRFMVKCDSAGSYLTSVKINISFHVEFFVV